MIMITQYKLVKMRFKITRHLKMKNLISKAQINNKKYFLIKFQKLIIKLVNKNPNLASKLTIKKMKKLYKNNKLKYISKNLI